MKISRPDSDSTAGLGGSASVGPAETDSASKLPAEQAAASDQAQISTLSRYLASALDGSPAHVAKLSELGDAVSSGQYYVDAHAVSASIIQHRIEFGGAQYPPVTT